MGLKLEVGKYYRDENGEKRGPMRRTSQELNDPWPFVCDFADSKTGLLYVRLNGETQSGMGDHSTPNLIAPWHDTPTGPVRTVTRTTREIVSGEYGGLDVGRAVNGTVFLAMPITNHCQESIDALIANLTAIRDALEDNHADHP